MVYIVTGQHGNTQCYKEFVNISALPLFMGLEPSSDLSGSTGIDEHTVQEVTYHWRHRAGNDLMLHYSVTDGNALYELIYNATEQVWVLESIDADKA